MNNESFQRAAVHAPTLAAIVMPLEVLGVILFSYTGHPVVAGAFGFALLCDMIGYVAIEWKMHQLEKARLQRLEDDVEDEE